MSGGRTGRARSTRPAAAVRRIRQGGLGVVSMELLDGVFFDQSLVSQPLDGSDPCLGITQGVPGRDQLGVSLVELVPEAPERAPSRQGAGQALVGAAVADGVGEVDHVLVPDVGRQRVDQDQVQLVELDRVLAINTRVAGPEGHLPGSWVDQPMLVVGLIGQRGGYLLNIDGVQLKHLVSVRPGQVARTRQPPKGNARLAVDRRCQCVAPVPSSEEVSVFSYQVQVAIPTQMSASFHCV